MQVSAIDYVTADERVNARLRGNYLTEQRRSCEMYLRARGKYIADPTTSWKPRPAKMTNILLTFAEYEKEEPGNVEPFVLVGIDIPAFLRPQAY